MLPKVVMHNEVSLDGAIRGFPIDLGEYYAVAGEYGAGVFMVGSVTATTGIDEYMAGLPPEGPEDFRKPEIRKVDKRPYWAIVDSKGALQGKLHAYRRSGHAKDAIIVASKTTPKSYLEHLKARNYDYIIAGEDRVDLKRALELLKEKLKIKTVLLDSGGVLNARLFEQGLVDEVSLIVAPFILGKESRIPLFRALSAKDAIGLKLIGAKELAGGCVHLRYKVKKDGKAEAGKGKTKKQTSCAGA